MGCALYKRQSSITNKIFKRSKCVDSVTIAIQNTVRTTSTNMSAQHHVEIVCLSIWSNSLGATPCVVIYRLTTLTVHQSHEIKWMVYQLGRVKKAETVHVTIPAFCRYIVHSSVIFISSAWLAHPDAAMCKHTHTQTSHVTHIHTLSTI